MAYDCVYDYMTAEERAYVERNLFRPMADFLMNGMGEPRQQQGLQQDAQPCHVGHVGRRHDRYGHGRRGTGAQGPLRNR